MCVFMSYVRSHKASSAAKALSQLPPACWWLGIRTIVSLLSGSMNTQIMKRRRSALLTPFLPTLRSCTKKVTRLTTQKSPTLIGVYVRLMREPKAHTFLSPSRIVDTPPNKTGYRSTELKQKIIPPHRCSFVPPKAECPPPCVAHKVLQSPPESIVKFKFRISLYCLYH